MAEKNSTTNSIPESRNTGVLAKVPKAHGKGSWRNFFGVFSKLSEGSVDPSTSSKSEAGQGNRQSVKKNKEKVAPKVDFRDEPSSSRSQEDPLALKVTLPSGLSNSDFSVSVEVESNRGKRKIKNKDKSKMYLTCVRQTEKLSEFEGELILPPDTDINKLSNMPMYFVDTEGNPLKSDNDDYTVFEPVKNTLNKNVDIGMKIKDVHLKVKLEKLNFNKKPQKIPKYLTCSFVTASQCPPPNPNLLFNDEFDFYDDDDEDGDEMPTEIHKTGTFSKPEGVSTCSSKIVGEILQNVVSVLPIREQFPQYNYNNPDYMPKKESADSILPRSSCTTINTMGYSEISSYYTESVPQNTPNERLVQAKVRQEALCQGDEYYNYSKQLDEDKQELLEHQRRVQELDKTLELLQNARSKLTSFLEPCCEVTNMNMTDPGKLYHLMPLPGVQPVSYLCAPQSPGTSSLSAEKANLTEMVSALGQPNEDTDERNINTPQLTTQYTSSNTDTPGDFPLTGDPSVLIVKTQTKLGEDLQRFRDKDKSKSNIDFIPQHKYLRSITTVTPKVKLNTIQNLYFSPKFTVEFNAAAYEGLSSLYEKRYGIKSNQDLASRESDITYNIVENDIKSMIHDLLKETWTIKETVLENFGKDKFNDLNEHEVMERESSSNVSVSSGNMQYDESNDPIEEIHQTSIKDSEFSTNTAAIPYQVNYCIINNPQKSPMLIVNKLNAYQDINTTDNTINNKSNEIYGFEKQLCTDDNLSDKKDSGTDETFESQYSKGYNVITADMPINKSKTKFILNTAQIQEFADDEHSTNDDDYSVQDESQPSQSSIANRSGLKSTKFADINTTKNMSETDTDFAETVINTVYSTSPDVPVISSFNSNPLWEPTLLITHTLPVLQSFCHNHDDETVIKETDLTKKNVSLPIMDRKEDAITQPILTEKKSATISHKSKYSSRSKSTYLPCDSSSSILNVSSINRSTQTIITIKAQVPIISDSDSEGIRIVQPNPLDDSDSHIALKLKKPQEDITPIAGTSRITDVDSLISSYSHHSITSEDYYADTDNITISLPNLRYKHSSVEELNSQEEIQKIEQNIQQNNSLNESRSKGLIGTDDSYDLNMDDSSSFISTQSSLLLTEDEEEL